MCLALAPAALFGISAGVSAAGQVANYFTGQSNADAQEKYQRSLHDQNKKLATENYFNQSRLLNLRRIQESQRATQEIAQVSSDSRRSQSLANVAAGEAGVSGNSVVALRDDFFRQESGYIQAVRLNEKFASQQLREDQKAIQSNAASRISQTTPRPVQRPSFLNLGLGIAGSAFNAYNDFAIEDKQTGYRTLF